MEATMEIDNPAPQKQSVELAREKKKKLEALLTQMIMTISGHKAVHKFLAVEDHMAKETVAAVDDELDPTQQQVNQMIEDIRSLDAKSFEEFENTINPEFEFNAELFDTVMWIRSLPMQFKNDDVIFNGMKTMEIRVGQHKEMLEALNATVEEYNDSIEKFEGPNAVTTAFMENAKLLRGKRL